MKFGKYLLVVFGVFLLTLAGCDERTGDKSRSEQQESLQRLNYDEYIQSHTTGTISKTSKIRVRFSRDIVDASQVGKEISNAITFKPSISGKAKWVSPRELRFTPEKLLPDATEIQAELNLSKELDLPEVIRTFSFNFGIKKQEMEIRIENLVISSYKSPELPGILSTADYAEPDRVKKLLKAKQSGKELPIHWTHSERGQRHRFIVQNITRTERNENVVIEWNGDAIRADQQGTRTIKIPARKVFKLQKFKTEQGAKQSITIYFSDPLDTTQNLEGLVYIPGKRLKFHIENNMIRVYPQEHILGEVEVIVESAIRNISGGQLQEKTRKTFHFKSIKPAVKFVGKGIILPKNNLLTVPIEAVNVHSLQVTAFEVREQNIGQFLQTNNFDGTDRLKYVGRYLWRKTISLNTAQGGTENWRRYYLNLDELFTTRPNSLLRLTISINRGNSTYSCTESSNAKPVVKETPYQNIEDNNQREKSSWDYWETQNTVSFDWYRRHDPCNNSYYHQDYNSSVFSSANFLFSDFGIIAKQGENKKLHVAVTKISTAEVLPNVEVGVYNFQNHHIASGRTDSNGLATIELPQVPYYLVARKGNDQGYLKLNKNNALATSHFDVGGEFYQKGVKGIIYGERGVWRPGDKLYLTFVKRDPQGVIPKNHPVTMDLLNPFGHLIQSRTLTKGVGDFYAFQFKTDQKAKTGNWKAVVKIGGLTFEKKIRIETVVPNRLKVNLDFGKKKLSHEDLPLKGRIESQWLHGAPASMLKSNVNVRFTVGSTRFPSYSDYVFKDPAREYEGRQKQTIFDGTLDEKGFATFQKSIRIGENSPGMLNAHFETRVFERGGAFSSDHLRLPFSPYKHYLGIKPPKGDEARGMLLTDTEQKMKIVSLDQEGKPVSLNSITVTLYKINWKWWWDKSAESLAKYSQTNYYDHLAQKTVATKNGEGEWGFTIKYPDWGRYMVRACDNDGGHCTGKIIYVDWPGWAGKAREEKGSGATRLSFTADKQKYVVGETAKIKLPAATQGRALLSLENASGVIRQEWITMKKGETVHEIPITAEMTPNVYASVSFVQPHQGKRNDRPVRLYGTIPIHVEDPATKLIPQLESPDVLKPMEMARFVISEKSGQPMDYTLAVVDEGLLGLTRHKVPNLRSKFYKKEALKVLTWDLYDDVIGAYGGELERLLSIGGSDRAKEKKRDKKKRFPPVVKFLGPFHLNPGEEATIPVKIPQYVGAVRIMVVAGNGKAYGSVEKSVPVKQPIMVLPTLPRVLGPGEELSVPVSLFVLEPKVKSVQLKMETTGLLAISDETTKTILFDKPDEKIVQFKAKVQPALGPETVRFTATSNGFQSTAKIDIQIRSQNPATTRSKSIKVEAGENLTIPIQPHGVKHSNEVELEVSSIPPINFAQRLKYLIRYPHGCLEQTLSAVFPQLYIENMTQLSEKQKQVVEKHINVAIHKLQLFQRYDGGFSYWPGNANESLWGNNYAGLFLIEASRLGYFVPSGMLELWAERQQALANSWTAGGKQSELTQANRLYSLALHKTPELGAMNRLRERNNLPTVARWQLAASYQLAGQVNAAKHMTENSDMSVKEYKELGNTFGSTLRDRAIILKSLIILDQREAGKELAKEISEALASPRALNTQEVSWSLLALLDYYKVSAKGTNFEFSMILDQEPKVSVKSDVPVYQQKLEAVRFEGSELAFRNDSKQPLFLRLNMRGVPEAGKEHAISEGLSLHVLYYNTNGALTSPDRMEQGKDFIVEVTVNNKTREKLENLALTHIVPSGWEIHNPRFAFEGSKDTAVIDYQDIRDDRLLTYFQLQPNSQKSFRVLINASYTGKYYLPGIRVEAMYDSDKKATTTGKWIEIHK